METTSKFSVKGKSLKVQVYEGRLHILTIYDEWDSLIQLFSEVQHRAHLRVGRTYCINIYDGEIAHSYIGTPYHFKKQS